MNPEWSATLGAPSQVEPVDAVVTWVDSSCPRWQAERRLYADAEPEHRFTPPSYPDAEVSVCLALLVKNLPWLRQVWLVTSRPQVPRCLQADDGLLLGKVRVVHHDEIFEHGIHLPTFSSKAIEAHLWRIAGLSERFLYLNDDMYVLRPLARAVFFDGERPVAWLSKPPPAFWAESEDPYRRSWWNLRQLRPRTKSLHHFPVALAKEDLQLAHSLFAEQLSHTLQRRVRTVSDVPPIGAAVNLSIAAGRSVAGKLPAALFRERVMRMRTVKALASKGYVLLCVNRQPFTHARLLHEALTTYFLEEL